MVGGGCVIGPVKVFDPQAPGWRCGVARPLTEIVLGAALEVEFEAHLGYPKYGSQGRLAGSNSRNGTRTKRVRTVFGAVEIQVPRDRWGTFEPVTIGKWQREAESLGNLVLPLAAEAMPVVDRVDLLSRAYGSSLGMQMVADIAASIRRGVRPWHERSLSASYPLLIADRVTVSLDSPSELTRPMHTVLGVTPEGEGELLGVWASTGQPADREWMQIATDLHSRGVADVGTLVSLEGPEVAEVLAGKWPASSIVHRSPVLVAGAVCSASTDGAPLDAR